MLQVREVWKSYFGGTVALAGVDLDVPAGTIVALLGPNGAGKTTLVSIVAGLRRADSGRVRIADIDAIAHPHRARRYIGLAPQDTGVYPVVSVRDNLVLFGELAGLGRGDLDERIDEIAAALGLDVLLDRLAGTLSGGEKRRLHTAIALLHRPPLLLLDEPTTGADVATRRDLLEIVRRLAGEGAAILYSTHYMPEVEALGASVAILERGRVIARGSIAELVLRYGTAAVELTFHGPVPPIALEGTVSDGTVRIRADDPAQTVGRILGGLGPHAERLASMEIIRPSLESVYLTLTGRRYDAGDAERPGVAS